MRKTTGTGVAECRKPWTDAVAIWNEVFNLAEVYKYWDIGDVGQCSSYTTRTSPIVLRILVHLTLDLRAYALTL